MLTHIYSPVLQMNLIARKYDITLCIVLLSEILSYPNDGLR